MRTMRPLELVWHLMVRGPAQKALLRCLIHACVVEFSCEWLQAVRVCWGYWTDRWRETHRHSIHSPAILPCASPCCTLEIWALYRETRHGGLTDCGGVRLCRVLESGARHQLSFVPVKRTSKGKSTFPLAHNDTKCVQKDEAEFLDSSGVL